MDEQQNNQIYQQPNPQPPVVSQPAPNQPIIETPQIQPQPVINQPAQPTPVAQQQTQPQEQPQPTVIKLAQSEPAAQAVSAPTEQPQSTEDVAEGYKYQSGNLQATEGYKDQPVVEGEESKPIGDSVSWSASEFILHEKTSGWHLLVGVGSVILAIAIYFLTKSIFGSVTIVVVGVIVSIFGNLKPNVLDYTVSPEGITIGEKHYEYLLFRSFAVIDGGQHPSLQLMPQKRFAVPITMYFAPLDGERIVDILGEYLPFEHQERDLVDKLSARLRF